jgi:hypothetical protein
MKGDNMKDYLIYELDKGVSGYLKFQILSQSPKVKKFLKFIKEELGMTHYLTKSGYKVAISDFPEFKLSENTIFLRGSMKHLNDKIDSTPFVNDRTYRNGAEVMFKAALKELVAEVARADKAGWLGSSKEYAPRLSTFNCGVSRVVRAVRPKRNILAGLNKPGIHTFVTSKYGRTPSLPTFGDYDYGMSPLQRFVCTPMYVAPCSSRPSYRSNVVVVRL